MLCELFGKSITVPLLLRLPRKELIVIGKGIGFPAVPYELTDMSRIDRTFYDIDPRYFEMISTLPQEILLASADITEDAQVVLNTTLNF